MHTEAENKDVIVMASSNKYRKQLQGDVPTKPEVCIADPSFTSYAISLFLIKNKMTKNRESVEMVTLVIQTYANLTILFF